MKPFDPEVEKLAVTPITRSRISPSREVICFDFCIKLRKSRIGRIDSEESLEDPDDLEDFKAWEKILAKRLFAVNGVLGVTFEPYEISVQIHSSFNPEKIKPELEKIITNYFVAPKKVKKVRIIPPSLN